MGGEEISEFRVGSYVYFSIITRNWMNPSTTISFGFHKMIKCSLLIFIFQKNKSENISLAIFK